MLWLVFRLYKEATLEISSLRKTEKDLNQPNLEAEDIGPRTAQPGLFESLQKLGLPLPDSYKSPLLLLISLAVAIGAAEGLTMMLLPFVPPLSGYATAFIDSAILLLVISPALYFIFFRPLLRQFIIRERAEKSLERLNLELEKRVEQRTAQLQTELAERKRVEERLVDNQKQLRSLSSELSLVEEQERRRIAADLHDNIGQMMAMVKNQLGILRTSISDDQGKELLDDIKDLVEKSIRYSRTLIFELSSPLLDYLSFVSAVEWLAEDILEKNCIAVHLKVDDGPKPLADKTRVLWLKAIQELLVNVVKHAKAHNVEIFVHAEADDIIVEIKDDGIGFEVPADLIPSAGRHGFGLLTVRERLTHLNGRFSIKSKPGQGTYITLAVPMQKDTTENAP
jgi:signal transduction histidine kinase